MTRVASVTVLFHPDKAALDSISSYSGQVDKCFLIDNSPRPLSNLDCGTIQALDFEYRHMNSNVGSAAALNEGLRMAVAEGYRFVLTVDQDSRCSPRMVDLLLEGFHDSNKKTAIACPNYGQGSTAQRDEPWTEVKLCITSGSLVDANVWTELGGFDERLFIDYVDHEYCLRVRAAGYRVMNRADASLDHHTGQLLHLRFLSFRRSISIHEPERLFYMIRNGLLLKARYGTRFPEVGPFVRTRIAAQAIKSLVFGPDRRRRLACMMRGYEAYRIDLRSRPAQ